MIALVLCCASPSLPAFAADAGAPSSDKQVSGDPYQTGMAAFQAGDYETACPLLAKARLARPNDSQLLLDLAISQYSTRDFAGAEQSYRALHAIKPDDARVTYELGRALTEQGKYEEARKCFGEVDESKPPKELRSGLNAMLDKLDDLEKAYKFTGYAEVSVLNDDNVNVGPNDGTLGNVILDPDTYPKPSVGLGYTLMLGAEYKLDPKGLWTVSGGLSRNEIRYQQETDYNVGVTNVSLRLARKLDGGQFQAALNYTDIEQGEMNSVNTFSPSIMWVHGLDRTKQLITDASVEFQDNRKSSSSSCTYYAAGEYLRWFFGSQNEHYVLGGLRLFRQDARSKVSSNWGDEFKLAPSFACWWKTRLDLAATWGKTWYDAPPSTSTENDREDTKHTLSIALSRELWGKNSKGTLSFIHTRNRSNYVPNSYFKNTAKFAISYSF